MSSLAVVAGFAHLAVVCLALQSGRKLSAEEEDAYSDVREAVVGTDSVNDVLEALPQKGGLLKLIYDNLEAPTVLETLEVQNKEVTIQGQGQQGPALTCNGNRPVMRITGGDVSVMDIAVHGCENVAVELVSPKNSKLGGMFEIGRSLFLDNFQAITKPLGNDKIFGSVNITETEFIHGSASAVELHGLDSVTISSSTFYNNTSGSFGGAVALHTIRNTDLLSSSFVNCSASSGGAIWASDGGESIKDPSSVNIKGSTFEGNSADEHGGAMYLECRGLVAIADSLFTNNVASGSENSSGGAVFVSSYNETSFMTDNPQSPTTPWSLIIMHSLFEGNVAGRHGGGLYAHSYDNGTISISDTNFTKNTAGGYGGGMFLEGNRILVDSLEVAVQTPNITLDLLRSNFHDNVAQVNGGGAFFESISSGLVDFCTFMHCSAPYGGGITWYFKALEASWAFTVKNSLFMNNIGDRLGGGINVYSYADGATTVVDTKFVNNIAQYGGGIGAETHMIPKNQSTVPVHFPKITVDIRESHFLENGADWVGGALYFSNVTSARLDSCDFEHCSSRFGGAIGWYFRFLEAPWSFEVTKSAFRGNRADNIGGAISLYTLDDGVVSISRTNFTRNTSPIGGGVSIETHAVHTDEPGGSVYYPNITVNMEKSNFMHNRGDGYGGGAYLGNITMANIDECVFEHCRASTGAGIGWNHWHMGSPWSLRLVESLVRGNRADSTGGGLNVKSHIDGTVFIQGSHFENNAAHSGGGISAEAGSVPASSLGDAAYFPKLSIEVVNSKFINNTARRNGGGLDLRNVTVGDFRSCVLKHCTALHGGGGGMAWYSDFAPRSWFLSVAESEVSGNWAAQGGGGLNAHSLYDGIMAVDKCHFTNNTGRFGGGFYAETHAAYMHKSQSNLYFPMVTVNVQSTNFLDNVASRDGGGMYFANITSGTLGSCTFENCSSNGGGGGVSWLFDYPPNTWLLAVSSSLFVQNEANSDGGGINIHTHADGDLIVEGSNFTMNGAGHWGGGVCADGRLGQIYHSDTPAQFPNISAHISSSTFIENTGAVLGGGVYLANITVGRVDSCKFHSCLAPVGAGLAWYDDFVEKPWTLTVTDTELRDNVAATFGGGISTISIADGTMVIEDSKFINNTAQYGGGVLVRANPKESSDAAISYSSHINFKVHDSTFLDTSALLGGGSMYLWHLASVEIVSSIVRNCSATLGGGLYWQSNFGDGALVLKDSRFSRNMAENHGGVMYFDGNGHSIIQKCHFEENQSGGDGGALFFSDAGMNENYPVVLDSKFVRNEAHVGGALYGYNLKGMDIKNVVFHNNKAAVGGAAAFNPGSTVKFKLTVTEAQFSSNSAKRGLNPGLYSDFLPLSKGGGAVAIVAFYRSRSGRRTVWMVHFKSSVFKNNMARNGGAILATSPEMNHEHWLKIEDCTFKENSAVESGDAIAVDKPDEVDVMCSPGEAAKSLQEIAPDYCENWRDTESVQSDLAGIVASLSLGGIELNNSHIPKIHSRPNLPPISLTIYDALRRSRSFGGIGTVEVTVDCDDDRVLLFGELSHMAVNGTATFTGIRAWGPPGNYTITFKAKNIVGPYTTETVESKATFELRGCLVGERNYMEGGRFLSCQHCSPRFYSFDPSSYICEECKENAECGSSEDYHVHPLVPKDGYWHSSPFSTQIHKCLTKASCTYDGRKIALQIFSADSLPEQPKTYSQTDYPLCREGSEGPLCGSCGDQYGHVRNGQCEKCSSEFWPGFGIFLSVVWMATMIVIISFLSFPQTRDTSGEYDIYEDSEHDGIELSIRASDKPDETTVEVSTHQASSTETFYGKRSEQLFKIAINFFQVNSAALLMTSGWRSFLRTWLEIGDVVALASISTTSDWIVPECAFPSNKNKSIIVSHLDGVLPLAVSIFLAAGWAGLCHFRKRRVEMTGELRIVLWSAALYCYVSLTKAFTGMFNCIRVDNELPGDPMGKYSVSNDRYWVPDTRFLCYKGHARLYSLVVGSAGFALLLLGLPIFLFVFFFKSRRLLGDADFKSKYGFLYGSYHDGCACWEAVIMLRKFLVVVIAVFAASMTTELHGGLMLGVMIGATVAQLYVRPFKDGRLNFMEALSLFTTSFTFYVGVVMNHGSQHWKASVSGIVLVLNLIFCVAFVVNLGRSIVDECLLSRVFGCTYFRRITSQRK